jgi:hypothetical protein
MAAELHKINSADGQAYIFDISNGAVNLLPKPPELINDQYRQYASRAENYKNFLQNVVTRWLPNLSVKLALGMDDCWLPYSDIPTFSFQKLNGNSINIVDPDLLMRGFLEDEEYIDIGTFSDKLPTAVFYGSTTGDNITVEKAINKSTPRLNAAEFFYSKDDVIFRLPQIVQCENQLASQILADTPFCQGPLVSWQDQFKHKFIISMDGNGATCSRVVLGLRSNSVLLKYRSDYQLYYFHALVPWQHFIPINNHQDILDVISAERARPGLFGPIAAAGAHFAKLYLNREAIEFYTAEVLNLYSRFVFGYSGGDLLLEDSDRYKNINLVGRLKALFSGDIKTFIDAGE